MSDKAIIWSFVIFFAVIVIVGIAIKIEVWQECRNEHSFLYCLQLVKK